MAMACLQSALHQAFFCGSLVLYRNQYSTGHKTSSLQALICDCCKKHVGYPNSILTCLYIADMPVGRAGKRQAVIQLRRPLSLAACFTTQASAQEPQSLNVAATCMHAIKARTCCKTLGPKGVSTTPMMPGRTTRPCATTPGIPSITLTISSYFASALPSSFSAPPACR